MSGSHGDRRANWRELKVAAGLCGNCGRRPLAVSRKTGRLAVRCRACLDTELRITAAARRVRAARKARGRGTIAGTTAC